MKEIRCPTCRRRGDWFATRWGPFCSERCRWIDLGKWLGEEHRISQDLSPGDLAELDEASPESRGVDPRNEH